MAQFAWLIFPFFLQLKGKHYFFSLSSGPNTCRSPPVQQTASDIPAHLGHLTHTSTCSRFTFLNPPPDAETPASHYLIRPVTLPVCHVVSAAHVIILSSNNLYLFLLSCHLFISFDLFPGLLTNCALLDLFACFCVFVGMSSILFVHTHVTDRELALRWTHFWFFTHSLSHPTSMHSGLQCKHAALPRMPT